MSKKVITDNKVLDLLINTLKIGFGALIYQGSLYLPKAGFIYEYKNRPVILIENSNKASVTIKEVKADEDGLIISYLTKDNKIYSEKTDIFGRNPKKSVAFIPDYIAILIGDTVSFQESLKTEWKKTDNLIDITKLKKEDLISRNIGLLIKTADLDYLYIRAYDYKYDETNKIFDLISDKGAFTIKNFNFNGLNKFITSSIDNELNETEYNFNLDCKLIQL